MYTSYCGIVFFLMQQVELMPHSLRVPRFNPELRLSSVCSFCLCNVLLGFLWVLRFLSSPRNSGWIAYVNSPLGVNMYHVPLCPGFLRQLLYQFLKFSSFWTGFTLVYDCIIQCPICVGRSVFKSGSFHFPPHVLSGSFSLPLKPQAYWLG